LQETPAPGHCLLLLLLFLAWYIILFSFPCLLHNWQKGLHQPIQCWSGTLYLHHVCIITIKHATGMSQIQHFASGCSLTGFY
jgi:hypothetical protein